MYKIGIKHKGVVMACAELSKEEIKKLGDSHLTFLLDIFQKKFGLNIGQYGLNEYENIIGSFFIHIRTEDLERLRNDKLAKLGL
jgi:hypothetical protein